MFQAGRVRTPGQQDPTELRACASVRPGGGGGVLDVGGSAPLSREPLVALKVPGSDSEENEFCGMLLAGAGAGKTVTKQAQGPGQGDCGPAQVVRW